MECHSILQASLRRIFGRRLQCTECGKQKMLYSSWKLAWMDRHDLEQEIGGLMYTCGMTLQDVLPSDLSTEAKQTHLLSRVFVWQNMFLIHKLRLHTSLQHALRSSAVTVEHSTFHF